MAKQKVYIGLSGGVDSSVAALLLQEQGYEVVGIYMKNFDPLLFGEEFAKDCHWLEDQEDARAAAQHLGMAFKIWNFEKEYYRDVIDYFFDGYAFGQTPNPDVMCNRAIKFGAFLDRALEEGADFMATGHYARLMTNDKRQTTNKEVVSRERVPSHSGRAGRQSYVKLLSGVDTNKDQSYFLWTLTQKQLRHTLFPIGEFAKSEVREIARKAGLPNAAKPDSQGICFVGEFDITKLLKTRLPEKAGDIVTTTGEVIGKHQGAHFYTEGQRKGLKVGGGIPYFVTAKDVRQNVLTVAKGFNDKHLFKKELQAYDVNWLSGIEPEFSLKCQAQIRYRQAAQVCIISPLAQGRQRGVRVDFLEAQRAVTPGQSVVFYQASELLGGGIID